MADGRKDLPTFKYHADIQAENNPVIRSKNQFTPNKVSKRYKNDHYLHSRSAQHPSRGPDTAEEKAVNILHDLSFSRDFEDVNVKNLNSNLQEICKNNFDEFKRRKSPKKIKKVEKQQYSRKRPKSLQQARTERSQMSRSKQNLHSISSKQLQMKFSDELSQTAKNTFRQGQNVCFNTNFSNFPGFSGQNSNLLYLKPKVEKGLFKNMPNKQIKFMNVQRQNYSSPYEYNTNLFENSYIKKQKIFNINPNCKIQQQIQDSGKGGGGYRKYINSGSSTSNNHTVNVEKTIENLTPFINNNSHLTHLEYSQYSSKKSQISSSPSQVVEGLSNFQTIEPLNENSKSKQQTLPNFQSNQLREKSPATNRVPIPQTLYNNNIQSQFKQYQDRKVQQMFENFVSNSLMKKQTPFQQYQGRRGMTERKDYFQKVVTENDQKEEGNGEQQKSQRSISQCEGVLQRNNKMNQGREKVGGKKGGERGQSGDLRKKTEKENKVVDNSISEQFYDDELRKGQTQFLGRDISVLSSKLHKRNVQRFGV